MRHLATTVIVATAVIQLSTVHGQVVAGATDTARFEGTWVLDAVQSDGAAERRVIRVLTEGLHVELQRPEDTAPLVLIYNLDGSDHVERQGKATATTRLRRDGNDMLTEAVLTVNDTPVTVHERLRLNAEGTELTVETTLRVEHGYQGVASPSSSEAPNVGKGLKLYRKE